jgi:chloramphenicol 3-O-phosphotransferase
MSLTPLVLISGLPGAGKSSVARRVAESFSLSLHLRVDELRAMMVRGHLAPDQVHGWDDRVGKQLVMESLAATTLAAFYRTQGVTVILDDVAIPPVFSVCYPQQPGLHKVLLLPSLETTLQRLAGRGAIYDATFTAAAPQLHAILTSLDKTGWTVFDSSAWSVEETSERVIASIPNTP